MANISVSLPSDGETIDASDYNTPINTIVNDYNGNIDNSNIATAAAIDGSKMASNSIPVGKMGATMGAGTAGDGTWNAWTPTLSGRFNDSKWTKSGSYMQTGKTVTAQIELTANAATPMDGGTAESIFTLPVTSAALGTTEVPILGTAMLIDTGTAALSGVVQWRSTTTAHVRVNLASGTYTQPASTTSTVPFTWASGDKVYINIEYQAA